jgi:hypothetical protein
MQQQRLVQQLWQAVQKFFRIFVRHEGCKTINVDSFHVLPKPLMGQSPTFFQFLVVPVFKKEIIKNRTMQTKTTKFRF